MLKSKYSSVVNCPQVVVILWIAMTTTGAGLAAETGTAFADLSAAVETLRNVRAGGQETAVAREAIAVITQSGSDSLIPVLKGFNNSTPLAENWLRNAVEELADAAAQAGRSLPVVELEQFVLDRDQSPVARRLAYEMLKNADSSVESRLIPRMLDDPAADFRRDAVAMLIADAKMAGAEADAILASAETSGNSKEAAAEKAEAANTLAKSLYRKALSGVVHEDQVKIVAAALREYGETVNIQKHFGFLPDWKVIGPFDNRGGDGFSHVYPPEDSSSIGLTPSVTTEVEGQLGTVSWKDYSTDHDFGVFDIAKLIENYKGSVMYASSIWHSDRMQTLDIRLGTPNAWKLWVNGKQVFEREEYHRSSSMDQYRVPVTFQAGENLIVIKICQNEQEDSWAQRYQFQLRICDSTGVGRLSLPR